MSECPKCKNKLLTVTSYMSYWTPDQEPYEAGKFEDHDEIHESVYVNAEYCEKCEAFLWINFEAEMIKKEEENKTDLNDDELNEVMEKYDEELEELKQMQPEEK